MARPIQPTPTLRGKEAKKFLQTVAQDLEKPLQNTSAPCLEAAKRKIFAHDRTTQQKYC